MTGIIGLYVRAEYALFALKVIDHPKLGDKVYFKGEECTLIQGRDAPYWELISKARDENGNRARYRTHISAVQMQPLWQRGAFSFYSHYNWLMDSWYNIRVREVQKKIKAWLG